MKTVKKFSNSISANLAKGMLENEGIHAVVLGENIPLIAGVCNTDLLCIELAVNDSDYNEACKLLAACSSAE